MRPSSLVTFEAIQSLAVPRNGTSSPSSCTKNSKYSSHSSQRLNPRSEILNLGVLVGNLCHAILQYAPLDPPRREDFMSSPATDVEEKETRDTTVTNETLLLHFPHENDGGENGSGSFWSESCKEKEEIANSMGALFCALLQTAHSCSLDLRTCILKKMELNGRKYPVELCKGKSGKYTQYSHHTGITKTNGQSTISDSPTRSIHGNDDDDENDSNNSDTTFETVAGVTSRIRKFATDRKWSRYHTPRNIVLALMGELGELAELFQWRGDDDDFGGGNNNDNKGRGGGLDGWSVEEMDHVGQELADVSIYLLRLADVCRVDLGQVALRVAHSSQQQVG